MDLKVFDKKFESFRKACALSSKHICWTCILRFLDQNWHCNYMFGTDSGDRIVKFCLDILMEHDCIDKTFLYTILEFYFRWHFHDCTCKDEFGNSEAQYIHDIMSPLKSLECSFMKIPFSEINMRTLPLCVTDVKLFFVLCKYGIDIDESVFSVPNVSLARGKFMQFTQDDEQMRHEDYQLGYAIRNIDLLPDDDYNWKMPLSHDERGIDYFHLLIRTLLAVSLGLQGSPFSLNFVECFRVFYRTIPHPIVCQKDVKEFIGFLWELTDFELTNLNKIFKTYLTLFEDDCPQLYSPRPLKHLCRVAVRKSLKQNLQMLPRSVKRLHIPRELKTYLLCIEPLHM